jgi:hypothetical protein
MCLEVHILFCFSSLAVNCTFVAVELFWGCMAVEVMVTWREEVA